MRCILWLTVASFGICPGRLAIPVPGVVAAERQSYKSFTAKDTKESFTAKDAKDAKDWIMGRWLGELPWYRSDFTAPGGYVAPCQLYQAY
jgi:hypothetical protein